MLPKHNMHIEFAIRKDYSHMEKITHHSVHGNASKISVERPGLEPRTFQFLVRRLNRYGTQLPYVDEVFALD